MTSSILDNLFHRDETPEREVYVQSFMPNLGKGDVWHCTKSHRTYMSVKGATLLDPGFNDVVEVTAIGDCDKYNCPEYIPPGVAEPKKCNGLCMTGHDIGVPSSEIAYPHPECEAHGK